MSLLHDWISIEPEISSGVLQITDGEVQIGIVKDKGQGYFTDNGIFVPIDINIKIGSKIFFTQHLTHEIEGLKVYRVRSRDVIEVL